MAQICTTKEQSKRHCELMEELNRAFTLHSLFANFNAKNLIVR